MCHKVSTYSVLVNQMKMPSLLVSYFYIIFFFTNGKTLCIKRILWLTLLYGVFDYQILSKG